MRLALYDDDDEDEALIPLPKNMFSESVLSLGLTSIPPLPH
uniref:Uncharacterized protein n=1 Tax=Spodoptera exigua multiple nucleopolyhedrovirus TaxID=10454 RepID=A0A6N0CAX2_9ABAC|nr:hypothetical protein [Spodoptera exigua multiple nucleopolyhedrovirus]